MPNKLSVLFLLLMIRSAGVTAQDAGRLNMEVMPDHLAYIYSKRVVGETDSALEQIYAGKRRWENGRVLKVCFFNANPVVVQLIRSVASEWLESNNNLSFDFGAAPTWHNCLNPKIGFPQIRVGFSERGFWSYVGSDSERYGGERAPSMNLDSFNRIYSESKYSIQEVVEKADAYDKATIRHEFGHAIGLLHEHQNPNLNCRTQIKWEGPGNVYEILGGDPNYWTKEQVERNFAIVELTDPDYVAGDADSESIMKYSLSKTYLKDPESKCAGGINYEISRKDRQVVSKLFPKESVAASPVTVSESSLAAFARPAPQFLSKPDATDYVERVVEDLESGDTATRRNARVRLSQVLGQAENSELVDSIISDFQNKSYRYKIGVASAIAEVRSPIRVSKSSVGIIKDEEKRNPDKTLNSNLKKAISKFKVRM